MAEVGEPDGGAKLKSCPVPLRLTVCVLPVVPLLLSVTVSEPLMGPPVAGVKVTLMVQEPPAATLLPQLLVCAKFPLVAILATARAAFPVLDSVTVCGPLVELTSWALNVRLPGETPATGPVPVPLKLTVCVLPATKSLLSVMVRVPVSGPGVAGEKVMLIVQEPPTATIGWQLSISAKLALATMLVTVRLAPPVLLTITCCDALVVPRV